MRKKPKPAGFPSGRTLPDKDLPWIKNFSLLTTYLSIDEWELKEVPNFFEFLNENFPGTELGKGQMEAIKKFLPGDPKLTFTKDKGRRILVLLAGKGSGKGFLSTFIHLYFIYLYQVLRDPLKYFGLSPYDYVDMVNVGTSEIQAKLNYFDRLKNRIKDCKFFKENYKIVEDKRVISEPRGTSRGIISISSNIILFPKHLRCINAHTRSEGWEGGTVLFFVMDEASAHSLVKGGRKAETIFDTLITSTRELPYYGIIQSYPRLVESKDFTYVQYKLSLEGKLKGRVGIKTTPWEFKPERFFSKEFFYFDVTTNKVIDSEDLQLSEIPPHFVKIPKDYYEEFITQPLACKVKYLCFPIGPSDRFFPPVELREYLSSVPPLFRVLTLPYKVEDEVRYLRKSIELLRVPEPGDYVISIDGAERNSNCVLSLLRIHGGMVEVPLIIIWSPNPEENIRVDLKNVIEVISYIYKSIPHSKIRMDQWNASLFTQDLISKGIPYNSICEVRNTNLGYEWLSELLISKRISFLLEAQSYEFEELDLELNLCVPSSKSKPVVLEGKQDVLDSLCGGLEYFAINKKLRILESEGKSLEIGGIVLPVASYAKISPVSGIVKSSADFSRVDEIREMFKSPRRRESRSTWGKVIKNHLRR